MTWRAGSDQIKPTAPIPAPRPVPGKRRKGTLDRNGLNQPSRRRPEGPSSEENEDAKEHGKNIRRDDDGKDGLIDEYA